MDTTIIKNNLSAFNKKSDLKHGLPSWAYTSEEFFDAESKTVFTVQRNKTNIKLYFFVPDLHDRKTSLYNAVPLLFSP